MKLYEIEVSINGRKIYLRVTARSRNEGYQQAIRNLSEDDLQAACEGVTLKIAGEENCE